jgi:hypothetical protein
MNITGTAYESEDCIQTAWDCVQYQAVVCTVINHHDQLSDYKLLYKNYAL